MYKNIWQTLEYGIRYKEQNYNCSCFAAAYQNLNANILNSAGTWINEYSYNEDYLQECVSFNLDEQAPTLQELEVVFTKMLLHDSVKLKFNNSIVDSDLLALKGVYNQAYIVAPAGLILSSHSSAFFCKRIQSEDYFVCLTTMSPYNRGNYEMYIRPCVAKDGTPFQFNVFAGLEFFGQTRVGRPVITPGALVSFT